MYFISFFNFIFLRLFYKYEIGKMNSRIIESRFDLMNFSGYENVNIYEDTRFMENCYSLTKQF